MSRRIVRRIACCLGAWIAIAAGPETAHADLMDLKISFKDFGDESTTISDTDMDCMISLGDVNASPNSQFGITAIDPTKPIVTAVATPNSVELVLTNVTITAFDDGVEGTIVFEGMWAHAAGAGDMTVSVGGTFGPGTVDPNNITPDAYSVESTGEIGPFQLTVGPLTGPDVAGMGEAFGDSESQFIVLGEGVSLVRDTLTFSLGRVGSTLTFPDSAVVEAELSRTVIPEPSTFALASMGFLGVLGYVRRARNKATVAESTVAVRR